MSLARANSGSFTFGSAAGQQIDTTEINRITSTGTLTFGQATTAGTDGDFGSGSALITSSDIVVAEATTINADDAASVVLRAVGNVDLTGGIAAISTPNLSIVSDGSFTLSDINIGAGTLTATVDANNDSSESLTVGATLVAGTFTFDTGGAGNDTLVGSDAVNTWTVTGANAGTLLSGVNTTAFSGFANLTGGGLVDTFNLNVAFPGIVDGGGGADIFNITDGALVGTLTGGADLDTIVGADVVNAWNVTAANAGTLNVTQAFTSMENLTGGTDVDTFVFADTATVLGTINGGGGTADVLDLTAYTSVTNVNLAGSDGAGFDGTAVDGVTIANFDGISDIRGGTLVNTLTGANVDNTWTVSGANAGTLLSGGNTTAFSGFANLTGGGLVDTFDLNVAFPGIVDGGGGADIFNITDGALVGTLTGGADLDTIVGADVVNAWNVTAANAGTLNVTQAFTSMENLTGGTDVDTFTFADGVTVGGVVDGGGGIDEANFLGATNLILGGAGLISIETLTAPGGQLTGPDAVNLWTVTGLNAGTLLSGGNTTTFSGFANLTGGGLVDTFVLTDTFTVSGVINGAVGIDVLDLTAYTSVTNVNIAGSDVQGFDGVVVDGVPATIVNFDGISDIRGGTLANTLTGADALNTWTVSGANAGTLLSGGNTTAFSGFANLTGGGLVDTFNLNVAFPGIVDGGGGADIFNITNGALVGTLTGGADLDTIVGADVVNAWNVTAANAGTLNVTQAFTSMESLTGGTAVDTFVFADGVTVGGVVNGGGGTADVLDLTAYTSVTNVNLAGSDGAGFDGTAVDGVTIANFDGISDIRGGTLVNTLTGANVDNTWTVSGANAGTLLSGGNTTAFSGFANLTGGGLVDTFDLNVAFPGIVDGGGGADIFNITDGALVGTLTGGADLDTIVGADVVNAWNVTAANAGTLNVTQAFTSMENLTGGTDVDTFVFADTATVLGTINGAGGTADVLDLTAYTSVTNVNLAGSDGAGFDGTAVDGVTIANFDGISDIRGGTLVNTLTGANVDNTWTVSGANAGTLLSGGNTTAFSGFANLTGGGLVDTFDLNVAFPGTVDGGGGADIFNINAAAGNIDGGDGDDLFNLTVGTPFVRGGGGNMDRLDVTGSTAFGGAIEITAIEIIRGLAGNRITADRLKIDGATSIGASFADPVSINVNNLEVTNSTGNTFFDELNNVVLLGIDLAGASIFNLIAGGAITDAAATTVDAGELVLSGTGIGSASNPIDTTATKLNITANTGSNAFVRSSAGLLTSDITLSANGGAQNVVVESPTLTFDADPLNTTGFVNGDTIRFATTNDIVVSVPTVSALGGFDLDLLAGNKIDLPGGTTTFDLTPGTGRLGLGGEIRADAAVDELNVIGGGIDILADTIFAFDNLNFNIGAGEFNGTSTVTFVPFTQGKTLDVGNGTVLNAQNIAAINGFNGKVNIGGVSNPTSGGPNVVNPGIAGDVTVTQAIALGPDGELTVVALGDLTVEQLLTAKKATLIAVGNDGSAIAKAGTIGECGGCILDVGTADVVKADDLVLVANKTIGVEENALNVDIATLDFGSGQDDLSGTLKDLNNSFTFVNLGPGTLAIQDAFQAAFVGVAGILTLQATNLTLPSSNGLVVRDEGLFSSDASAFGEDFLIFDPGEGITTPFDQDPDLPSREDYPFVLEDEAAWDEFYRGNVLEFVKGRWLADDNLIAYVTEQYGLDLSTEGAVTFEQLVALRDQLLVSDRTAEDLELLRLLEAFINEYPDVVAHFRADRIRVAESNAVPDLEPLDLPDADVFDQELPTDVPADAQGLPQLPSAPTARLHRFLEPFASLRVLGQSWSEGGMGIEDTWSSRLPSAFPTELPSSINQQDS